MLYMQRLYIILEPDEDFGYVPERPFPKKAVEKAVNKKKPIIPPNSMIGQFTAVLKTTVLGTAFLG